MTSERKIFLIRSEIDHLWTQVEQAAKGRLMVLLEDRIETIKKKLNRIAEIEESKI